MVDLDRGDSPQQSPNTYTGRIVSSSDRARRGEEVLRQTGVILKPISEIPNADNWFVDNYEDPREAPSPRIVEVEYTTGGGGGSSVGHVALRPDALTHDPDWHLSGRYGKVHQIL